MSQDFVHLHVHSDYSMLDGACRIDRLCERAAALGQSAVAITDHGNMFGALDLYEAAEEHDIRAIVGCEFYVTPSGIENRTDQTRHHLILLAKDYEGYRNLCRLNAIAWGDAGHYYKPRIDRTVLRQHCGHLVALSACISGEIPDAILSGNDDHAREAIEDFIDMFGEDFYLELQYHGAPGMSPEDAESPDQRDLLEKEQRVNARLLELHHEYGVELVCTNDAHYLNEGDHDGHDALLCIGTQSKLEDEQRLRFSGDQFFLKSGDQMAELFAQFPRAVENTVVVAEKCRLVLPLGENHYPVFRLEDGGDDPSDLHCAVRRAYLRNICLKAMAERYDIRDADAETARPDDPDAARRQAILERMDFELGVIDRMGYVSYFLVVWDFIRYARSRGIPVGPGRGSGAGSIVAYLTGITNLDPLAYNLLFERFLNPDRVSPPDFDIDFCERRRGEVIEYVRDKYGAESVAQIGTFGTLKAKAVLKDVARVSGVEFADANRLVAHIPTDPKMTLARALKIPEIRAMYDSEDWVADVFEKAKVLEGLNRNQSTHACGVIIGDQPLRNVVPLSRGANKECITQFPAHPCEDLGLLKMDFLGLKTLTIIADTLDMIHARTGERIDPESTPLDDGPTYELLNRGATVGVFQLESGGMQDLCRSFGIRRLEEIIALVALYRPGPMEFIPAFIDCKKGLEQPEYETPEMERILSETYGIMVYQEQIMQVVQAVAGFTLAQADLMRRAISKKTQELMDKYEGEFIDGCIRQGHSRSTAESIWAKIKRFAEYGFNKSHSACYGLMSYRTAFLKANFPAEFMAAVLNGELGNADKMAFYIAEAERMGLQIMPPSVNGSQLRFGVADGIIRFGLGAIKGVGSGAAESIIAAREEGGAFADLVAFCERCGDRINRRVMENLCRAGAFDCFEWRRSQVFAVIDQALSQAQQTVRDRESGQGLLFDALGDDNPLALTAPDLPEWDNRELLGYEKALVGFYVSGHPVDDFEDILQTYRLDTIGDLTGLAERIGARVGGLLASVDLKRSKSSNRPWAIVRIEDRDDAVEAMVFADVYERFREVLLPETVVFLEGSVNRRPGEEMKLLVERVVPAEQAPEVFAREVHIRLHERDVHDRDVSRIIDLCRHHAGETSVVFCIVCDGGEIAFVRAHDLAVRNSASLGAAVRDLLGDEGFLVKPQRTRPEVKDRGRFRGKGNGRR